MSQKIILAGTTGVFGRPVANAFLHAGFDTYVLTRNKARSSKRMTDGFHFVEGDVTQPKSITNICKGMDALYIGLNSLSDKNIHETIAKGTRYLVKDAKKNKVKKIVLTSSVIVSEHNSSFLLVSARLEAENYVRKSGIPYVILRPSNFMEGIDFFVRGKQITLIGDLKNTVSWVSAQEYGRLLTQLVNDQKYENKTVYVAGNESLSLHEALMKYRQTILPDARINRISHSMMSSIATFSNNSEMQFVAKYIKFLDEFIEPEIVQHNGTALIHTQCTMDEWLQAIQEIKEVIK